VQDVDLPVGAKLEGVREPFSRGQALIIGGIV
jgi:hypothetical protein